MRVKNKGIKRCIVGCGAAMVVALSLAMDAVDAVFAGDVSEAILRGLLAVLAAALTGHFYAAYRRHADEAAERECAFDESNKAEGSEEPDGCEWKGRR